MKKSIKLPYKAFSLLLALILVSVSVPIAFAAETLKASNVTQYPTISYKNADGKMYFGQTEPEALIINDDEIVIDANGNQVAGHFTFKDDNKLPLSAGTKKLNLTFVPDNTEEYTSFNKMFSSVTYEVVATVPVFVDEINDPLVASEVEAGSTLSTSILSGGKLTNPYNPEESTILTKKWEWTNPDIIVNESGYYEARVILQGYVTTTEQVYVKIASNIPETTISEMPVIEPLVYDASMTLKDVVIKGGVAVLKAEGTVVDGTFSIAESAKDYRLSVGNYNVPVTFTPTDPEAALPYTFDVPITVTKAPIRFVDENGNDIVPEITVPYGTDFNYIPQLLKPYVKGAEYTLISLGDLENTKVTEGGIYTITASAPSDGANYEKTELSFKIIIEKKKISPKLYAEPGKLYIEDTSGTYRPEGTFTLTYYIEGDKQGTIEGIKYLERFDWNPTKSGNYRYEIVYVDATENEHYIIEAFNATNPLILSWAFKAPGAVEGTKYPYGSDVALEAPATDPAKADKPYYGFVKWEDANGNTGLTEEELSNREITFTMPDGDVELNATYKFDFCLCVRYYIQIVVDWFNSFFQSIGTLF